MKLVINSLGKIIIVVVVVTSIAVLISTVFIPGVRGFVSSVFPQETNYVDSVGPTAPKLSCATANIETPIGTEINIFENITALSNTNENLISQLTEDYAKPVGERKHVFVYKTNNNSSTLESNIDFTVSGKWKVFYLLTDNGETVSIEVSYTVV